MASVLGDVLREYDQSLILAAGATASVVVVTGIALCMGGDNEEPESKISSSKATQPNKNSSGNEKKKEKAKAKKKAKPQQVEQQPVVEEKKQSIPTPPPQTSSNDPDSDGEDMIVVKSKKNKKAKKLSKKAVEVPVARAPSPPPPAPEPEPVKEPPPVVSSKVVEEVKTSSKVASKKKAKGKKASPPIVHEPEPEPEPVVIEEPEPEPVSPPVVVAAQKKNKKNKKNKEMSQAKDLQDIVSATAPTMEIEPADVWTTVKPKRSSKNNNNNATTSDESMMGSPRSGEMLDVTALESAMASSQMNGGSSDDLLAMSQEAHSIDLGIFVASIIGKEGKVIKAITEKSGAKLKIGGKTGDSSICVITGDDEAVALADELIREILDREQAIEDKNIELNVVVGDKMPAVMGKKGLIIKKIVSESEAVIERLPNEDVLVIRGFPEQVAAAKALIDLYMAGGPPPEAREEVELGSERGRFIVLGPKGLTIRTIQEETGAKLNLEHNKTFVSVEGDVDAVASAVAQLRTLLDENSVCEKVSTRGRNGKSHIPSIVGKQGAVIRSLRDESGAAIDLLSAEDCVKISGNRTQVNKAKAAIEKILNEEDTPAYEKLKKGEICEDLSIPVTAIGMVIGRMGMMIKQIKDETGAEILVPKGKSDEVPGVDGGDPTTTAKVWGTKEAVGKAKIAIQEVLKKHEERVKMDKKRAAANGGSSSNNKSSENGGGGKTLSSKTTNGEGAITFFGVDVDDDIMPDESPEITFEVPSDESSPKNDWDAAATDAGPPGIAAAPGWS